MQTRRRHARVLAATLALALAWLGLLGAPVSPAIAQAGLSVAGTLDGVALGRRVALLRDAQRALSIADVTRPEHAARFGSSDADVPAFGYTQAAVWVRLDVDNPTDAERPWLLELGYPHLDDVTLYVPRADGGFEPRAVGDHRPFASRDLAYRTYVFSLREPPRSRQAYYLRVVTTSSLALPLTAWDAPSMLAHQPRDLGTLFAFYGLFIGMAGFNLAAWVFTRRSELMHYLWFILCAGLALFSLNGHTLQYLVPEGGRLAEFVLLGSLAATMMSGCFVSNAYMSTRISSPRLERIVRSFGVGSGALGLLTLVIPYQVSIRLLSAVFVLGVGLLVVTCLYLMRQGVRRARLYVLAWTGTGVGFCAFLLQTHGILPSNVLTLWGFPAGCALEFVLLSSGLADWFNVMRGDLSVLNQELSKKVGALEGALGRAEEATMRAEQATRVKDEFMATMSHELRTPLNAIINVPEGLLVDFKRVSGVMCARCASLFELEAGEQVSVTTPCPECGVTGVLAPRSLVRYTGKPEITARYLQMIERSGRHLLQMVNSILESSKLEAGRLSLTLESFDVAALVHDVIDELCDTARREGVRIESVGTAEPRMLTADPLRIKQVLINLVGNALKFSEGRGPITLTLVDAPDAMLFSIADRGIGISPADFERVFESFEQVHKGSTRKFPGTGLGLSISRSLVRMHGGEMWVESELGRGATFFFRIPRGLVPERVDAPRTERLAAFPGAGAQPNEELAS